MASSWQMSATAPADIWASSAQASWAELTGASTSGIDARRDCFAAAVAQSAAFYGPSPLCPASWLLTARTATDNSGCPKLR